MSNQKDDTETPYLSYDSWNDPSYSPYTYCSTHEWNDLGMLFTYCKKCNQEGEWDRDVQAYVPKRKRIPTEEK